MSNDLVSPSESRHTGTNTPLDLARLRDLHARGLYLQAQQVITDFAPLTDWSRTEHLVIGGRLAHNLGSSRLGRVMHRTALQQSPQDPTAIYFETLSMLGRRGPLKTIERMLEIGELPEANSEITADWYALHAEVLSHLRDFQLAETWLGKALKLHEERPWLHVVRTSLLEHQDRNEEALQAAREAFDLRPWYRPAVQNLAHRLVQANLDDEALTLMREANERLECGDLRVQQSALLFELEQYEEARELLEGIQQYYPYIHFDKKRNEAVLARRADAEYYCGNYRDAKHFAEQVDVPFYKTFAENLDKLIDESEPDHRTKSKVLPVKFVRQHHLTCAPATLSAISDYWGRPAEHLEISEKICYDGTPAHSERNWATSQGFHTREFRVTLETASALIDRGIPFTLTTIDPGMGHLQGVIGYDSVRESLRIREPGERHYNEFQTQKMLEHYASNGPRGMLMVPSDQVDLLEGIELPDAEFYDLYYEVEMALEAHDRDQAYQVVKQMRKLDDTHRLTLRARGNIANYDGNMTDLLVVTEKMLEQYPDDVNLLMGKLTCLQELGRREDRLEMLESLYEKKDCDPMFWLRYAGEVVEDSRQHPHCEYLLRRVIRYRPFEAMAYQMLATIRMDQQRQREAVRLHRFAACIGERRENQSVSYFLAAQVLNQTKVALQFLQDRVKRFGKQSTYPIRTYCNALERIDRTSEVFKLIESGCKQHPDDVEFMLYAADFYGRFGKFKEALPLLKAAKGKGHKVAWLRGVAQHHLYQGKLKESLEAWKKVAEAEPLDAAAHRSVAELLADTQSNEAAVAHLRKICERFPNSYSLRVLLIEWLREEDSVGYAQELLSFIQVNPSDGWAMRELAFHFVSRGELDQAEQYAGQAMQIDPAHPAAWFVRGRICEMRDQFEEAKQQYRKSLELSIDYEFALNALVECCRSKSERREELKFAYNELQKQVTFGDGLLSFRRYASSFENDELLKMLHEALKSRPDLWHAWSALTHQLSDMQRHDEAVRFADKAVKRFPLLPRLWIDRSIVHANRGDIDGEIESLAKAAEINPTWGEPSRLLSEAYHKKGDFKKAREIIETVLKHEPRDVRNHGFLANLMWQEEQKEEAIAVITKAIEMEPGYEWGWSALRRWCDDTKQPQRVLQLTQRLTETRPEEARSWLLLAESYGERDQIDQAVKALDQAIRLNPSNAMAYSQKAYQLCRAGQFDEALQACRPTHFGEVKPIELDGRAAWVEGERGHIETAVNLMEQVVQRDPDYFWAWHRLAEWYEYLNREEDYITAAKEMVRLAPQNPVSWGYLADGVLRQDNKQEAKKHFLQAVQLSPEYSFASGKLVDLQVEAKEYDEALATIELISPHIPPAWVIAERTRIESLRGNKAAAFGYLKELAVTPADDSTAMDSAVESLFQAKWGDEVMPLLDKLIDEPDAAPHTGYVFVHLSTTLKRWIECEAKLASLDVDSVLWKEAVEKYLEELGNLGEHDRLHKFIEKYRKRLYSDTGLWTSVGNRYNDIGQPKTTLDWMDGWETRTGVDARSAFVVAMALWDLKREHDAIRINDAAVRDYDPDSSYLNHQTLRAVYHLVYSSPQECIDAINEINPSYLSMYYQVIFQMVATVIENASTQGSYADVAKHLGEIWKQVPEVLQKESLLKRLYQLVRWRAATLHGSSLAAMWWKFQAKPKASSSSS